MLLVHHNTLLRPLQTTVDAFGVSRGTHPSSRNEWLEKIAFKKGKWKLSIEFIWFHLRISARVLRSERCESPVRCPQKWTPTLHFTSTWRHASIYFFVLHSGFSIGLNLGVKYSLLLALLVISPFLSFVHFFYLSFLS